MPLCPWSPTAAYPIPGPKLTGHCRLRRLKVGDIARRFVDVIAVKQMVVLFVPVPVSDNWVCASDFA